MSDIYMYHFLLSVSANILLTEQCEEIWPAASNTKAFSGRAPG